MLSSMLKFAKISIDSQMDYVPDWGKRSENRESLQPFLSVCLVLSQNLVSYFFC